jgi:hypothetical protein
MHEIADTFALSSGQRCTLYRIRLSLGAGDRLPSKTGGDTAVVAIRNCWVEPVVKLKHAVVIGLSALAIAAGLFLFGARRDLDSGPAYKVNQAKTDIRAIWYIYRYEGTGMPSVYSSGPNGSDEHGEGDDVTFTSH